MYDSSPESSLPLRSGPFRVAGDNSEHLARNNELSHSVRSHRSRANVAYKPPSGVVSRAKRYVKQAFKGMLDYGYSFIDDGKDEIVSLRDAKLERAWTHINLKNLRAFQRRFLKDKNKVRDSFE